MKKITPFLLAAIIALVGCDNTAEAVKKDAVDNGQKVADATNTAADTMKANSDNAAAALTLTPAIKAAIIEDQSLSESGNLVDVDSTSTTITLSGHVKSEKTKWRAEELARRVMADKHATQSLQDDLIIQP